MEKQTMNARELVDHVASRMGVDALELLDGKDSEFVTARRVIYYYLWRYNHWSYESISQALGTANSGAIFRMVQRITPDEGEYYINKWGLDQIQVPTPKGIDRPSREPKNEDDMDARLGPSIPFDSVMSAIKRAAAEFGVEDYILLLYNSRSGPARCKDVLHAKRRAMVLLHDMGYTARQIAAAFELRSPSGVYEIIRAAKN